MEKVNRRKFIKYGATAVIAAALGAIGGRVTAPAKEVIKEVVKEVPITPPPPEPVKIGIVYPLTGPVAPSGEKHVRGALLRIEEVNKAGGIKSLGGAKVEPVIADSKADPKVAASETERLIVKEKIIAWNGAYRSADTLPATEVTERYKIPAVVCAGAPEITKRGFKYVFRAHAEVIKTARISVKFLKEVVKAKSVAIVMEDTAYGRASSAFCEKAVKEAGMGVLVKELFPSGTTDLSPVLLKVKEARPDAMLAVGYVTDALLMMRQLRELDINLDAIIAPGGAGFNDMKFIEEGGRDAEYVLIGIYWSPDAKWPHNHTFTKLYTEKYGVPPDPLVSEAYEATTVILEGIERAGSREPSKIRDAIAETGLIWMQGPIMFDETGENIYDNVSVIQIQRGKFVTVWPETIAVTKPIVPMPSWTERK